MVYEPDWHTNPWDHCPEDYEPEYMIICPCCGGDGYFAGYSCAYLGSDPDVECSVCGGSGVIPTEPQTVARMAPTPEVLNRPGRA